MVKAGLGPDAVIAMINTSPTSFDLTTQKLIALKQAGVPDQVIAAMIQTSRRSRVSANAESVSDSPDPTRPHAPGIYALDTWGPNAKMIRMDAVVASQMKMTGMLGYAFSYGLAKMKFKVVLPNQSARTRVFSQRPTFYLYFEDASAGYARGAPNAWLGLFGASTTNPAGFTLVRFDSKNGNREATTGQFNITGMQSGVMDKARVAFTYSDVAPGVLRCRPNKIWHPASMGLSLHLTVLARRTERTCPASSILRS